MNKENIINVKFDSLIDYLREKDDLIDHLRYTIRQLEKRIEEARRILEPYVEDKEANRYTPIYAAYDELGGI